MPPARLYRSQACLGPGTILKREWGSGSVIERNCW
jgi:hypothetical protein